ncbi:hypothetical protein LTR64_003956 [Lithohypha guttulata]|uniref:uncharacterized protein n=1 Tax=Lithohypha guttulata TaxID=1690604 RepID=UPI002DDFA3AC|nr:hypothetical protein LTR51_006994 [Lithohypha guttulata]
MNSPARRVLGDKDKNAHLNIRSPKRDPTSKSDMATIATSRRIIEFTQPSSSPRTGNKRKIEEVEDAERVHEDNTSDSQRTQLLSDSELDDDRHQNNTSVSVARTSYVTAETSFSASQMPLEPHFELPQEEMSQRTLEKLNEVPMPQNNSQAPFLKPALLKEISAGSVGLANFINFDGLPSSQGSEPLQLAEIEEKQQNKVIEETKQKGNDVEQPSDAAARKRMLIQKAAELQTRLQLALYKVQTKQTGQPFSRLKAPQPLRQRSASPPTNWRPMLATPQLSSSTAKEPSSGRTITSINHTQDSRAVHSAEATIAAMRAQATAQTKPPVRDLNSLPMPQLDPALLESFDSQQTELVTEPDSHGSAPQSQHFPSSPPLSRHPSGSNQVELLSGLKAAASNQADVRQQLSSPPVSDAGMEEGNVQRTVSQGEAASGLVQLMSGR